MPPLLLMFAAIPRSAAAELPAGLIPVAVEDVLATPSDALADCTAGMSQRGGSITRWVGCGERTLSVIGNVPELGVDVEGMLAGIPASLQRTGGLAVRGAPTVMEHAGGPIPALRLARNGDDGPSELGLAVAWEDGVMQELGICLAGGDRAWCEAGLGALLTPRRSQDVDTAFPGHGMTLLMEAAPDSRGGEGRLLQPVDAPEGAALVGCQRFSGVEDRTVQRLDCTQGRVVVEPMPRRADASSALARILPLLSTPEAPLHAEGPPSTIQLGGEERHAATIMGESIRGVVVQDPDGSPPRALGCLDRAPGFGPVPWCTVALQAMWNTSPLDAPRPDAAPPTLTNPVRRGPSPRVRPREPSRPPG
ncbi:MAG: hypothetical protein VX000_05040 [Myxococcota bacterium]|nr:hypothetical protein [Myxococcota bacterium]